MAKVEHAKQRERNIREDRSKRGGSGESHKMAKARKNASVTMARGSARQPPPRDAAAKIREGRNTGIVEP